MNIAVIGMGVRAPGGIASLSQFWDALMAGRDMTADVPPDRGWQAGRFYSREPEHPGTSYTWRGGFLADVFGFDPHVFGLSPREAQLLDPQQRLAMEVAWEAVETAGIAPARLAGTRTGVYMGALGNDYLHLQFQRDPALLGPHSVTGSMLSGVSGRLSYLFGLRGPSITVDTACSSSLLAVHLACQALREGEIDCALAGGVNVILSAEGNVMLCRVRALAPDGRCKTFSAAADGYGRAEGAGVVILKRLDDALRSGDHVLACILGSAANQDGRHAAFTVPNGFAQEAVVREALSRAGVEPSAVDYVEAHGTGTAVGDPIEVRALARVFGGSRERPLYIGSVKTNLGHAESAAGVLGLIKTVLALQHRQLPPHLQSAAGLNPELPLDEIPAVLPAAPMAFPAGGARGIAGVSAAGFSGTNVHVVLGEAPALAPAAAPPVSPGPHLFAISGKTPQAVTARAAALKEYLQQHPETELADLAYTLGACRAHFEHRAACLAESRDELLAALDQLEIHEAPARRPALLLLCDGADPALLDPDRHPVAALPEFRQAVAACDRAYRQETGTPLPVTDLPARFAVQYALTQLWASRGIRPDLVAGWGPDYFAAACAAGALSLTDAIQLVAEYHRICERADGMEAPRAVRQAMVREQMLRAAGGSLGEPAIALIPEPDLPDLWDAVFADVPDRRAIKERICLSTGAVPNLAATLAGLYRQGYPVDFGACYGPERPRRLFLPTYPFQRTEYRLPENGGSVKALRTEGGLLGQRLVSPLPVIQFQAVVDADAVPEVRDTGLLVHIGHYFELLAQALGQLSPGAVPAVSDLAIGDPLLLGERTPIYLHTTLTPAGAGCWEVEIASRAVAGDQWRRHVRCTLRAGGRGALPESGPGLTLTPGLTLPGEAFYQSLRDHAGLDFGPSVRWLSDLQVTPDGVHAKLRPPAPAEAAASPRLGFPAGVLDAAAQTCNVDSSPGTLLLVVGVSRLELAGPADRMPRAVRLHWRAPSGEEQVGDLDLLDAEGAPIARLEGVRLRRVNVRLFRELYAAPAPAPGGPEPTGAAQPPLAGAAALRSLPPDERRERLGAALRQQIGRILREDIPIRTAGLSFADIGFDSLMAMELQNWVKQTLGVAIALATVIGADSIDAVIADIDRRLDGPPAAGARSAEEGVL